MSKSTDLEKIAVQLEMKLKQDTPENIVTGLAELVMKKDTMRHDLYMALMGQLAGHLYLKTLDHNKAAQRREG